MEGHMMPEKNIFRCLFYFAMFVVTVAGSLTQAAPPSDAGSAGRGNSPMDRALESRARILDRSRGSSMATASATGTSAVGSRDNSSRLRTASDTAVATHGRETAADVSANALTDRPRRTEATFSLDGATHRSPHAERSPNAIYAHGEAGSKGKTGLDRASTHTDREGGIGTRDEPRTGWRFGWLSSGKPLTTRSGADNADNRTDPSERSANTAVGHGHDGDRKFSQADSFLTRRLAQIDRMRDNALETGDTELLREADRLEVLARAQHTQRTTGEHSVGSAMRTFNRDPRESSTSTVVEVDALAETNE